MTGLRDRCTLLWNNLLPVFGSCCDAKGSLVCREYRLPEMKWFKTAQTHTDTSESLQWMRAS